MQSVLAPSWLTLTCTVLGGYGHRFTADEVVEIDFREKSFEVRAGGGAIEEIFYMELVELSISGPGTVTKGGGFIGGGFGVDGAIGGIATAAILNALTTRSKINTFLQLVTNVGEIHLHYGGMEPAALRMALAEVFVTLRRLEPLWLETRRALIEAHKDLISEEQYRTLVERLLQPPKRAQLSERQGSCPNCNAIIPLLSPICPKCDAQFGMRGGWRVKPL